MPFDMGDTVPLAAECRDTAGTLVTAATVALTVTLPDGTVESPAVSPPGTAGEYSHDYAPTVPGRYSVRWVFTGPASAYTDVFDVRPEVPALILSLSDAKRHLNISTSSNDEELRAWIESVTALVEQFTGVAVRATVTETHELSGMGARSVALRRTPVLSLTSVDVVGAGTAPAVASLDVDTRTGIVRPVSGVLSGTLRFVYVAGREVIPANLTSAAKIILQHLWRSQTGARGPVLGGSGEPLEAVPGFGYAIPNRALQLMEPHRLPPGVA